MAAKEKPIDLANEDLKEKFNELEQKKPAIVEKRTIKAGYVNMEETLTVNERDNRIGEININDLIFGYELVYDEGRDQYRAAYMVGGRKQSLSFFNNRLQGYKAILITICSLVGLTIRDINVTLN